MRGDQQRVQIERAVTLFDGGIELPLLGKDLSQSLVQFVASRNERDRLPQADLGFLEIALHCQGPDQIEPTRCRIWGESGCAARAFGGFFGLAGRLEQLDEQAMAVRVFGRQFDSAPSLGHRFAILAGDSQRQGEVTVGGGEIIFQDDCQPQAVGGVAEPAVTQKGAAKQMLCFGIPGVEFGCAAQRGDGGSKLSRLQVPRPQLPLPLGVDDPRSQRPRYTHRTERTLFSEW